MQVNSRVIRSFLRDAWAQCQAGNPHLVLRPFLVTQEVAARKAISGGVVKVTTGNGHSTEFETTGSLTPDKMSEIWDYLIEEFDLAAADLGLATDGTKDAQIEAEMEQRLRPVMNVMSNYMYMSK